MTRRKYLGYWARFQRLAGRSPEEFLGWAETVKPVEVQDIIDSTATQFKPAIQFCCRVALRSFLRHNGYNSLPKADLQYVPRAWHRGYRRHEIRKLLGYLPRKLHKLFCYVAAESGLRVHTIMELRYRHVMEDLEGGTVPVAVRLEPRFYTGRKAAGHTFLGEGSVELLRECLKVGLIEAKPDARLVPRNYHTIYWAIYRARKEAGLDRAIQPCHGFRKYFENALDQARVDHERKMIIEGHLAGTRAKYYTDRDIEQLREVYRKAYSYVDLEPPTGQISQPEIQSNRYQVLESKLIMIEDELATLRELRKMLENLRPSENVSQLFTE